MDKNNRAYQISLQSREYVRSHDRNAWLGMFAEDGIIEDPIGKSDLDPEGKGWNTPAAREAFWDRNIANSKIDIDIRESFTAAGNEFANVVRLTIELGFDGKRYLQIVDGVFTYRVDAHGKLKALRGYWEYADGLATLREIG